MFDLQEYLLGIANQVKADFNIEELELNDSSLCEYLQNNAKAELFDGSRQEDYTETIDALYRAQKCQIKDNGNMSPSHYVRFCFWHGLTPLNANY